jgi:hypothetical protein
VNAGYAECLGDPHRTITVRLMVVVCVSAPEVPVIVIVLVPVVAVLLAVKGKRAGGRGRVGAVAGGHPAGQRGIGKRHQSGEAA